MLNVEQLWQVTLNHQQRRNVHVATVNKLQNVAQRGDTENHTAPSSVRPDHNNQSLWDWWHMGISGECAGHDFIGAVFNPERYTWFDKDELDVAGLFDMKTRRPSYGDGQPSDLIVRDYEIADKQTVPHVLAYASNLAGQPNAVITLMGWLWNHEIVENAHHTMLEFRASRREHVTAYYVNPERLHPMGRFPY